MLGQNLLSHKTTHQSPQVAKTKEQEAQMIWEIATNLGVTGIEKQGRIVEKLMQMEDRDQKEVEGVGNRSNNP